jgi:hypothetical protein
VTGIIYAQSQDVKTATTAIGKSGPRPIHDPDKGSEGMAPDDALVP